jgi:hypothetical protein
MKAQMMKIAGYKNEKDFYAKFPTEASFKAKYGKELKKMQYGGGIPFDQGMGGYQNPSQTYQENFQSPGQQQAAPNYLNYNGQFDRSLQPVSQLKPMGSTDNSVGGIGAFNVANLPEQTAPKPGFDFQGQLGAIGNVAEGVAGAISKAKQQKRELQEAKQMKALTDVGLQASRLRPEQMERKYVRPEDTMNTGEEFFPIYGVGSNPVDSAEYGGNIRKAKFGGMTPDFMNQASGMASKGASALMGNDAGSQFGAAAGDAIKMIPGVGPVASAIAKPLLTLAGGLIDRSSEKKKKFTDATGRNIAGMQGNQFGQAVQQQYSSFAENGTELPMYEEGGEYPMYVGGGDMPSYENGGEYQTEWGGELEAVSHNPYSEGSGITYMANGNTHDESDSSGRTGIGVKVMGDGGNMEGGADVEVQDNEPISDGVVFGALKISKENASLLGDDLAKNKRFETYIPLLNKKEVKYSDMAKKNTEALGSSKGFTSIQKLEESSYKANVLGANMNLKNLADKKARAAELQSSINETAEEFGLDAAKLAEGKYKKMKPVKGAKYGTELYKAFDGVDTEKIPDPLPEVDQATYDKLSALYNKADKSRSKADVLAFQQEYHKSAPKYAQAVIDSEPLTTYGKTKGSSKNLASNEDSLWGTRTMQYMSTLGKPATAAQPTATDVAVTPAAATEAAKTASTPVEAQRNNPYMDMFNQALPFLRSTDTEELDPRQLSGEMYALSNNQIEPVQSQSYQPQLDVPYDISLQEIRNQNQADYRAAQRMGQGNQAYQAQLNAQKYAANQKVGADEFRMNQGKKDQVYSQNRATMNDAQLKNIGLNDQQYVRQSQAKSNTKAITQAALSSIGDKYAKNKLENRTLQTYENMYNYRFDKNYRAINENPLAQFDISVPGLTDAERKSILDARKLAAKTETKTARNGAIIKSLKNL